MLIRNGVTTAILLGLFASSAEADEQPEPAKVRTDLFGDPLPEGAVARFGKPRLYADSFRHIAFSPDGKSVVTSFTGFSSGAGIVWDLATGRPLPYDHLESNDLARVCFTPDGAHLIGGTDSIRIVEPNTGQIRFEYQRSEKEVWLMNYQLSADGGTLVLRWTDSITIHNLKAAKLKPRKLRVEEDDGLRDLRDVLALSADGSLLLTVNPKPKTIVLWDTQTGRRLHQYSGLKLSNDSIPLLAFTPDGRKWALGLAGKIRVWDTKTHAPLKGFTPPAVEATSLQFSLDGSELFGSEKSRSHVVTWSAETGKELRRVELANGEAKAEAKFFFSPDGRQVARNVNNRLVVWDATTGKEWPGTERFFDLRGLRWVGPNRVGVVSNDSRVLIWDRKDGRLLREYEVPGARCLSPDGRRVAAVLPESVRLVDLASGKELWRLDEEESEIKTGETISFTADGKYVTVVGKETITVREVATGKLLCSVPSRYPDDSRDCAALSPDRRLVAQASAADLYFTERSSGQLRSRSSLYGFLQRPSPRLVRFSADGRRLAVFRSLYQEPTTFGADVCIYSVRDDQLVRSLVLCEGDPEGQCGDLSLDGRWLASGFHEGRKPMIRLYDLEADQAEPDPVMLDGHDFTIKSLAFSPDGKYLASASDDGTALVWDLNHLPAASSNSPRAILERSWVALASDDGEQAGKALVKLQNSPLVMPLLKAHLHPVKEPNAGRIRQLVLDLDDKDFATRERANRELEDLGELAGPELRAALARNPRFDCASRLQRLIDRIEGPPSGEPLRLLRAIEILEHLGTSEAIDLVKSVARGAPAARLTREAAEALERLSVDR